MDVSFFAGLGLGLSIGLGVALRLMAARDPVPAAPRVPRPPREPGTKVAVIDQRDRERMDALR